MADLPDLIARCKVWAESTATPFPQSEVLADCARGLERMRFALERIACFGDVGANIVLKETGRYSWFDEPGSVQTARECLASSSPDSTEKM